MSQLTLEDLSVWGMVEIVSIDEAALLWGGINPAFCNEFDDAMKYDIRQYNQAYVARKAFVSGIALGTLPAHEIWCFDYQGNLYRNEDKQLPGIQDISTKYTLVIMTALINWAENKKVKTLRQLISQEEKLKKEKELKQQPIIAIEHRPPVAVHDTPEYTAACKTIETYWNKQVKGVKPPKKEIIQEFISKTLEKITGVKPSQAEINRIDTLTRPPCFKNQQKTTK